MGRIEKGERSSLGGRSNMHRRESCLQGLQMKEEVQFLPLELRSLK